VVEMVMVLAVVVVVVVDPSCRRSTEVLLTSFLHSLPSPRDGANDCLSPADVQSAYGGSMTAM
jgi:hypothetical protein